MKLMNKYEYLDINAINYINATIRLTTNDDFDENEFNGWLLENDIESKVNPSAYVKKAFKEQLDKGTFKSKPKVEYLPNTQELINEMREKGICILADESVWVSELFNYLLNDLKLDSSVLKELNHKVLDYMKTKEFSEYKDLLRKSKALSLYPIDWKHIETRTQNEILKWNELLDDLESEE